jgi:leader peptidase (prepilin peptidase)/N-methyltransferase
MPGRDPIVLGVAAVFGAMLGSFLNVVIYRLPRKESLAWPGSHCPECGTPIRWYDNVPIVSWLVLAGKCRACRKPIPFRYPLVEALTGALTALLAWRFLTGPGPVDGVRFGVSLLFTAALVAVAFIDIALRIIPDRITKPGMVVAPVISLLVPALHRVAWLPGLSPGAAALLLSLAGMAVGAGSIWMMGVIGKVAFRKEAMGFGDVKLMGLIGGFLGPVGVLLAVLLACVAGSVIGILAWLVTRDHYIPFGPFLSLGAFAVLVFRPEVVHFFTVTYPSLFR